MCTSFERKTGQVDCLNDFISRNHFKASWENTHSILHTLIFHWGINLSNYHMLVDNCIFDRKIDNYVICDGANPSNHIALYLFIKKFRDMPYAKSDCIDRSTKHVCSWERASLDGITLYKVNLDCKLDSCIYD